VREAKPGPGSPTFGYVRDDPHTYQVVRKRENVSRSVQDTIWQAPATISVTGPPAAPVALVRRRAMPLCGQKGRDEYP
jgi:hypothetical protein